MLRADRPESENAGGEDEFTSSIKEFQSLTAKMMPETYINAGYGIPLGSEFSTLDLEQLEQIQQRMQSLFESARQWALANFPAEIADLTASYEARALLLKRLVDFSRN